MRPVAPLFFVSLRDFAANSFVNLLMALGILTWALVRYPGEIPAERLAAYGLMMGLGFFLNYVVQMAFLIPVFWMQSGTGLREIWFALERYAGRPDAIYTGWLRRILTSILPFALIVSFPTRVLFSGGILELISHMAVVTGIAFLALLLLWRTGLRAYGSASS